MAKSIFVAVATLLLVFTLTAQGQLWSMFCSFGTFNCRNPDDFLGDNCLAYSKVCDGIDDCYNGTDEAFCGDCDAGEIQCPNTTMCMNNTLACDGNVDCPDGTDESIDACGCSMDGYVPACRDPDTGTAYCINETELCDGNPNCIDGADEGFPYCPEACMPEQLSCFGNGSICVEMYHLCNGVFECPNGFDEGNCNSTTMSPPTLEFCPFGTFNCDNPAGLECMPYTSVCDGSVDCSTGRDESDDRCGVCSDGQLTCPNTTQCINNTAICDGYVDCPDGIDESVNACGCNESGYVPICRADDGSRYCINESRVCDGVEDCEDGADENNPMCPAVICDLCYGYDGVCIESYQMCDSMPNCPNGTDELNCVTEPPSLQVCVFGTFNCRNPDGYLGDNCLPYTRVCDGIEDCYNGTDEGQCGDCSDGQLMCPNTTQCINNTAICDGYVDCPDGIDESVNACGCEVLGYIPICRADNGSRYCISESSVCDGVVDCEDGADENNPMCPADMCDLGQFTCLGYDNICIESYQICDSMPNCPNGTDELTCDGSNLQVCPFGTYNCRNPDGFLGDSCLPYTRVCDGIQDCFSGSDEQLCGECDAGMIQCPNTTLCMNNTLACDGNVDCPDGIDESIDACGCNETGLVPICRYLDGGPSYCINESLVCDGYVDCEDGADEGSFCPLTPQTPSPPPTPYYGQLRLVANNGETGGISAGRLEVFINETWGTVCDDSFDFVDAHVACRQLGFQTYLNYGYVDFLGFNEGTLDQPIYLDNLACSGFEFQLIMCANGSISTLNCTHNDDVALQCFSPSTPTPPIGCGPGELQCLLNPEVCVTQQQICNGVVDCNDGFGFDEAPGLVELFGFNCTMPPFTGSGSGSGVPPNELIIGVIAPPFNGTVPLLEGSVIPVCIARSPLSSSEQFSVTLVTIGDTADADMDFVDLTDYTYTFGPDDSFVCTNITVLNDRIIEMNETFSISLTVNSTVPYTVVGPTFVMFDIVDDDGVTVNLDETRLEVVEGDDPIGPEFEICLTLTNVGDGLERNTSFTLYLGGSIASGDDFYTYSPNTNVTFPSGSQNGTEVCTPLGRIVGDIFIEYDEYFTFYVFPTNFRDNVTGSGNSSATFNVTIIDDDYVEFVQNATEFVFEEGAQQLICVYTEANFSQRLQRYIAVNFNITPITASPDDYYTYNERHYLYGYQGSFYPDRYCLTIDISADMLIEDDEQFQVTIEILDGRPNDSIVGIDEIIVTIIDNNGATFDLIPTVLSLAENSLSNQSVCLYLPGYDRDRLRRNVVVNFEVRSLEATNGVDFTLSDSQQVLDYTLSFNSSNICTLVQVIDDRLIESNETFEISIEFENPNDVVNGRNTTTVTIIDDDGAEFELNVNVSVGSTVSEGTEFEVCGVLVDVGSGLEREIELILTIEDAKCNHTDVRLVNGSNPMEGRVEVCNNGVWGTVCDDNWGIPDANVVCNQLGYGTATSAPVQSRFGQGTGDIVLDELQCSGTEATLFDCQHNGLNNNNCVHFEDASAVCSAPTCVDGDVRLVGGISELEGRVEVCNFGIWGTVCDDQWDIADAHVVCRQLGYTRAIEATRFNRGEESSIVLDDLQCTGLESTLFDCIHNGRNTHNCGNDKASGVVCSSEPAVCVDGEVRLVGGSNMLEGRVEVCSLGAWGTICDDEWDLQDAHVVCNQLGYGPALQARTEASFGEGNGSIVFDDVSCNGTESTIFDCIHNGLNVHNCDHSEDAGVECSGPFRGRRNALEATEDLYPYGPQLLVFPTGSTNGTAVCLTVFVVEDSIIELPEEFLISLEVTDERDTVREPSEQEVIVMDNDGARITLSVNEMITVSEGSGQVAITVSLDGISEGLERDVVVNVTVELLTAATTDIGSYPSQLVLDTTYPNSTIDISIVQDMIVEDVESFRINFASVNPLDMFDSSQTVLVYIQDDDGATLDLIENGETLFNEQDDFEVCVQVSSIEDGLERDVIATVSLVEGTAGFGQDFVFDSSRFDHANITFYAGSDDLSILCVNVSIIDDDVIENTESFSVVLSAAGQSDTVEGNTSTFTIQDNNGVTFIVDDPELFVSETDEDQSIGICITAQLTAGGLDRTATLTLSLSQDSISGVRLNQSQLTFAPAIMGITMCVQLIVDGDNYVEDMEMFVVNISPVNPLDSEYSGELSTSITVDDDDGVTVSFTMSEQTVMEDVGIVFVCVELTDVEDGLVRSSYYTITSDTNTTFSSFFASGASVGDFQCMNLSVQDDLIVESIKVRTFSLSVANDNDKIGDNETTVIRIVDDDGASILLMPVENVQEEDLDVTRDVCYVVLGHLEREVTITLDLVEETTDARIENGIMTVVENGTYCGTLVVAGDNLIENNETYTVRVRANNSLDMANEEDEQTFVIYDDDKAVVELRSNASETIPEDVGYIEVCAVLVNVSEGLERVVPMRMAVIALSEYFGSSDISPFEGIRSSYVASLHFPEGSVVGTQSCINFTISNDNQIEDDEMFEISLSLSQDLIQNEDFLEYTIIDNDGGNVEITSSLDITLTEGDGVNDNEFICVLLLTSEGLLERVVTVQVNSTQVSKNIDDNTIFFNTSLTFTSPGELCIEVRVEDDSTYTAEQRELELKFSVVDSNDMFIGDNVVKVTIEDDDSPLVEGEDFIPFIDVLEMDDIPLNELGPTDDGCSNLIFMNSGLPFGTSTQTELRVCANGAISFGPSHFNFFSPQRFPSNSPSISQSNVVTPFWNDHDARGVSSNVYYKVYSRDQSDSATNKLNMVSRLVTSQQGMSKNFTGNWMMVAYWNEVPPFPFGSQDFRIFKRQIDENQIPTNSYQGIVITDGVRTYTVFSYKCGMLQWTGPPYTSSYSNVGYNIDGRTSRFLSFPAFQNHRLSGLEEVRMLACVNSGNRIVWSNLVYLIGEATDTSQLARAECINSANRDFELFRFPNYDIPCPCSFSQARRDNRYFYASNFLASITGDTSFFSRICYLPRFPPSRFSPDVQLCCYSSSRFDFGALLDSSFEYEGSSLLRFHPAYDTERYLEYDYTFKRTCCLDAGICDVYTKQRPYDNCFNYRPQRRGWCWGDPHLTNLDGGVFTFNGWGEYTLLNVDTGNISFTLQGRTQPVVNSSATQLVAFAFGVTKDLPAEVLLDEGTKQFVVLLNGSDISQNVSNVNDSFSSMNISIERVSEKSLDFSFPNGIGITVTESSTMLGFVLIVPEELRNITEGLMGNFNGDPMDDVLFKNGSMLAHNVSDRMIHEVGQSWEILPDESLFTYPAGLGPGNFSHPYHIPAFLDEVVANASPEVLAACGNNTECIFDASETGDISIGLETMATNDINTNDQEQATNTPPRILGPNSLFVTLGEEAVLVFNVTDDKNTFNVSTLNGLPVNSTLTPMAMDGFTEFVFRWNIYEVVNRSLMFEARDELDAVSVLNVQVQICACQNGGNCTLGGLLSTTASTIVLNCECSEAWDGRYCTDDVDGCTEILCFEGVNCTDMPAPGVGAVCGPCPDGYLGDGEKCEDVNECVNGTHNCADICLNVEGAFECACQAGYRLLNATHCEDVDECAMLNGNCHQECNNFVGSFNCSCQEGYALATDNRTCQVLPESACNETSLCDQECVRLFGVETCSCNPGFKLDNDNKTCLNIDECMANPCHQVCNDMTPGFECSCNEGYELANDGIMCSDIDECVIAALNGTDICNATMFCMNTMGGYTCECPGGTELVDGSCREIIVTTAPPPTTATTQSPTTPLATLSPELENNALQVTLDEFSAATFTPDRQLAFRMVTATAINEYCATDGCVISSVRSRRQAVMVTADDVILTGITNNNQGQVTFNMHIETNGGAGILMGSNLENAVEEYSDEYNSAGFTVSVEPLVTPTTSQPPISVGLSISQIIGIAVGATIAAILLVIVAIALIICCMRYRSSHRKSFNFTYGLEYQNPVAEEIASEPAPVPTGDDIPMQGTATSNIYVNPREVTEKEAPLAKDSSSDQSMQSLILKFGDGASQESLDEAPEKEELTAL